MATISSRLQCVNHTSALVMAQCPTGENSLPKSVLSSVTPYRVIRPQCVNTLRPRQNGRRFADDTFKHIFLNKNAGISIKISLKFVPKGPINNIPALIQIMAWRRSGDKPLSEPMMVSLLTHICVTRPQWVNGYWVCLYFHFMFALRVLSREADWLDLYRVCTWK